MATFKLNLPKTLGSLSASGATIGFGFGFSEKDYRGRRRTLIRRFYNASLTGFYGSILFPLYVLSLPITIPGYLIHKIIPEGNHIDVS